MKPKARGEWPGAAALLGASLPASRLHPAAVRWAVARPPGERWAVALSGGCDSVCLLLLLRAHFPKRRLVALHFDHRLRGAESAADARSCSRLCRGLGVELVRGRWIQRRRPAAEALARAARFAFFEKSMAGRRLRVLWLGHQQDDIAETMLMRLSRGSGTAGLAAPRPVHTVGSGPLARTRVRPLLTLKKSEIARALTEAGASWREDSSNLKPAHFRNRVRSGVVGPWARAAGRDALAGAALARELLEEDDVALEAWVDALDALTPGGALRLAPLAGRPRAVVRRALHRWLLEQEGAGDLSRQGFEVLLASVERGKPVRHSLGRHGFAAIRKGLLRFETPRKSSMTH